MQQRSVLFSLALIIILGGFMSAPPVMASNPATKIDITTGEPFTAVPPSDVDGPAASINGTTGGQILWDVSHGNPWGYDPNNRYRSLKSILQTMGYTMVITNDIAHKELSHYDVVVINIAAAWFEPYTWNEKQKIKTYIQNGGRLLIMGDNAGCPNTNINVVAQEYGLTCGVSNINSGYYDNLATHPIFTGVSQVYLASGGEVRVTSPAQAVAWTGWRAFMAVAEPGLGRVVVTGDVNFCEDSYINRGQNWRCIENIFKWLLEPGTPPPPEVFDFNDGTLQGWTMERAYDEHGHGPFNDNFFMNWADFTSFPNPPSHDPWDGLKGSAFIGCWDGPGYSNWQGQYWIVKFKSPDLTTNASWQQASGFTAKIGSQMLGGNLWYNYFLFVFDHDRNQYRYVGWGNPLQPLLYYDTAHWNHASFDWTATPDLPQNYTVKHVYVCIWGQMSRRYNGRIFLDEVTPVYGTMKPSWIRVTYPNGGEVWRVNRDYTITWETDKYVGQVMVEISTTGGQSWWDVTQGKYTENDGNYTYKVVWQNVSENCYIRIRYIGDFSINDVSDHRFAIRWSGAVEGAPTDVAQHEPLAVPTEFSLMQNYPNPFNPQTTISYHLPQATDVSLSIFDLQGNEIRQLVQSSQAAGRYTIQWNGRDNQDQPVASGFYFYRLRAGDYTATKKCLLMK